MRRKVKPSYCEYKLVKVRRQLGMMTIPVKEGYAVAVTAISSVAGGVSVVI